MPAADTRNYTDIAAAVTARTSAGDSREQRMETVVDELWRSLSDCGVSWVGFYIADESQPSDQRLILGPRRDRPACSPIGLHGVCGAAYRTGEIQIIHDVADLGDSYVACDPRDRSEIVIPLFDADTKSCWGVLDLDSFEVGAFNQSDADGLATVLRAAGFIPRSA